MSRRSFWFWRDTGLAPQFLGVDAFAAIPFVIFIVHMRGWTLMLALFSTAMFWVLSRFGYTVPRLWNLLLAKVTGVRVVARPWWYWNRFSIWDGE